MKHYLLGSDFDQPLSFNDSGLVLNELLGIPGFATPSFTRYGSVNNLFVNYAWPAHAADAECPGFRRCCPSMADSGP